MLEAAGDHSVELKLIKPVQKCFRLSRVEILLYYIVWFSTLFCGIYNVYILAYNKITLNHFIDKGFMIKDHFGFYMSTEEYMWQEILVLVKSGWIYFLGYILASKLIRKYTSPNVFMLLTTIITISFHYKLSSIYFVLFEFSIFLSMFLVGLIVKRKLLIWLIGIFLLHYLNEVSDMEFFNSEYILKHSFPYSALLITRAISVGLLMCEPRRSSLARLFMETLYFYWYWPALIGCRMMTIRDFIDQIYRPHRIQSYWLMIKAMVKVVVSLLIWHLVICAAPYFLILQSHDIRSMDKSILVGGQLFYGLHFYMTYYIMYNSVYWLAQLDGFMTTEGPTCIAHISLYSQMWREFDRGLHVWIKDHIYLPLMSTNLGPLKNVISALASFGFVFVFHGVNISTGIFILVNFVQFFLESKVKHIYKTSGFGKFLEENVSTSCFIRLIGLACGLSFFCSIFGFACIQYHYVKALAVYSSYINGSNNIYYQRLVLMLVFCYVHGVLSYHVNICLKSSNINKLNKSSE